MLKDIDPGRSNPDTFVSNTTRKRNSGHLSRLNSALISFPIVVTAALTASGCWGIKDPIAKADQGTCRSTEVNNNRLLVEAVVNDTDLKLANPSEFIAIIRETDTNDRTLINQQAERPFPSFSPDGSKAAYIKDDDIYVVGSDGSDPKRLTDYDSDHFQAKGIYPSWSPDQKTIGYVAIKGEKEYLRFIFLENGEIKDSVADENTGFVGLSWSPDGKIFTYVTEQHGQTDNSRLFMTLRFDHNPTGKIFQSSKLLGEALRLPYTVRMNWSQDGQSLTYGVCLTP
jgi:hypothetical protein